MALVYNPPTSERASGQRPELESKPAFRVYWWLTREGGKDNCPERPVLQELTALLASTCPAASPSSWEPLSLGAGLADRPLQARWSGDLVLLAGPLALCCPLLASMGYWG